MKNIFDETLPNVPCLLFLDEVETIKAIYMVETKKHVDVKTEKVQERTRVAVNISDMLPGLHCNMVVNYRRTSRYRIIG